ncbi:MAG TPA: VWA domain-containing protein, partial [Pirellulales bacterium]
RTAAVLLFGLALARPYFATAGGGQVNPGQSVHAILLMDNSMSMGYRQAGQTVLDEAKSKARELIEALPDGSRFTVIPLCGGGPFSRDAYRTKKDAVEAIDKIEVTDRAMTNARALDLAKEAMRQAVDVRKEEKRVVLIGDQQRENWKGSSLAPQLKELPELQVVDVSPQNAENTFISDFRLLDGLADVSTPARFVAKITHEGRAPRLHVQATLSIDGAEVQSKVLDRLNPDQSVEVTFEYQFTDPPEPGQVRWSAAKVSIPPDRLDIDDSRTMVVPIVAALPVIFVDQFGESEDAKRNRLGETRQLRALLAPNVRGQPQMQLVRVLKRRIDQLEQKELREARLVVIAGVARPEADNVKLLRDYVRQGGQLIIAAGAEFDPAAWTEQAWLGGAGILPLPLAPQAFGHTPDETTSDFKVFSLKVAPADVPTSAYLQLPDSDPQDIADSLREPTFFKAVVPVEDNDTIDKMVASETKRIEQERSQLAEVDSQIQALAEKELRGQLDAGERAALERAQRQRDEIVPNWLLFDSLRDREPSDTSAAELAERTKPKVALRYDNQIPFLVERQIGRGRVLLFTSGFLSPWNDLPTKNAVWLIDRILRSRIESTLPERNVDTSSRPIDVPVSASERNEQFYLVHPNGKEQLLEVERIGRDQFGVTVGDFSQRGLYRMAIRKPQTAVEPAANKAETKTVGKMSAKTSPDELIAANGPDDESKLAPIDEQAAAAKIKGDSGAAPANYRWVARGAPISLSGAEVWGQDTWWWLILAVLVCLFVELAILAWPAFLERREAA